MRPILLSAALLCSGQPSQPQSLVPPPRKAFAWLLENATIQRRAKLNILDGNAAIEACGPDYRVLIIKDDSEEAKDWFEALARNKGTMDGLLSLGFQVVVLVNKKHGTFVFDLTSSKSLPELSERA